MFCWQNDCEYFPAEVVVVVGRTLIIWLLQSSVCVYEMSGQDQKTNHSKTSEKYHFIYCL